MIIREALSLENEVMGIYNLQAPGQLYHPQLAVDEAEMMEEPVSEDTHYAVPSDDSPVTIQSSTTPHGFMRWLMLPVILIFLLLFVLTGIGRALSLSQGYTTHDTSLKQGMVVSLSSDSTQDHPAVQSADITNVDKLVGVVVGMNESLITVGSSSSQVFVAATGQTGAYVSDLNGSITKGDLLSLSPLKGVLMKASANGSIGVIGTALEDFSPALAQTVTISDSSGKPATVHVVQLNIDINMKPTTASTSSQNWLQRLGKSITGHDVSELRVVSALAIFITLVVIEGTVIYSAVYGGLISMGRNPLAKNQIFWQLIRSMSMATVALLAGGAVIVIILWL